MAQDQAALVLDNVGAYTPLAIDINQQEEFQTDMGYFLLLDDTTEKVQQLVRKQIVLAIADVDCEDLTEPTRNQSFKLRHYNELGRRKIAKAILKISMIKKAFPAQMLIKDFINIDKHTGQNKFIFMSGA